MRRRQGNTRSHLFSRNVFPLVKFFPMAVAFQAKYAPYNPSAHKMYYEALHGEYFMKTTVAIL